MKQVTEQTIGERIAQLRQERGWTQQALAERIAISRVAISHIEMDLSLPSERTITLLAGVFKLSPAELVAGTSYPAAKAERLPFVVCCHTELELELALLYRDLEWLQRLAQTPQASRLAEEVRHEWLTRLNAWSRICIDPREREELDAARRALLTTSQSIATPVADH